MNDRMRSSVHTIIAMLCLLTVLLACKQLSNKAPKDVKASCDMRGASSGSSSICMDFYEEPNDKVKSICSADKGYTLANKPCDHSTALGGCKKENTTNWYYSSSRHSTADDVKKDCTNEFVAP
jgi:hypothetical protein